MKLSLNGHIGDLLSDFNEHELQVLEKRARDLSHAAIEDEADQQQIIQVLTFHVANETYAIRVEHVREVRPLKRLTRVPGTPNFVMGVINLRGNILSQIDLRRFFGITGQEIADLLSTVIVEAGGLEVGILVNRIGEVSVFNRTAFNTPPITVNGIDTEFIQGVSDEGVILLNLNAVMSDPRMIINDENF